DLENMTVLLPLLHEQKNIAYVLSTIRDAQEKNVALINSLREIKKSTLKHLFKYGVVSVDDAINVKLKETEIGLMPNTWVVVNLGDVAKYVNGYPFKPTDWKKVGLPIIRIQNLTGTQNNPNFFDGAINERYRIKNGDILISWSASLGVFNWKKEDAWLNQHIFKVEDYSPKITKEYFYYVVGTKIEGMKDKTHGSTMHHITKLEFLNVKIPLPPLQDQNNIVEILSGIDSQIEAEESKSKALQHLFDSMAKELTTAKIRVNKLVF
ncbi:MAG: restriction endonuclease subunit S, partial [Candidatus Diapherotrites archaeon]|nr:restriction endonuclease subunit S [Candidatus Diapherotrites archaeon]